MPLALLVEMRLFPGRRADFMPILLDNATSSLANEPGCRRFDVLLPAEGADRVVLYEIYEDEQAYAAHRTMEHYFRFKAAARDFVAETIVQRFDLVR